MQKLRFFIKAFLACIVGLCANANALNWQSKDFANIKNKEQTMQILIIGANGSVAKITTQGLLQGTKANVKLYLRNSSRLANVQKEYPNRVQLIEGDALDKNALIKAMQGVNVVYANLAGGDLPKMAEVIISAMKEAGLKRLIWISSYGVYGEVNDGSISSVLMPYAKSVQVVESSGLDYTIIRPQWFSSADEIDYEITRKNEAFKNPNAQISRKSIAHLVIRLCLEQDFGVKESLGINKPAK